MLILIGALLYFSPTIISYVQNPSSSSSSSNSSQSSNTNPSSSTGNMASTLLRVSVYPYYTPSYNTTSGSSYYPNIQYVFVPAQVTIMGTAWNIGTQTAYNCQLHVVGYSAGGVVALDTYINIGLGTQSVIYINGQMQLDTTINCSDGIVNWVTTPICTGTP
jgi:hypothetical protein